MDVTWVTPFVRKGVPITAELIEDNVLHLITASSTMRHDSQTTFAAETLAHIFAKFGQRQVSTPVGIVPYVVELLIRWALIVALFASKSAINVENTQAFVWTRFLTIS